MKLRKKIACITMDIEPDLRDDRGCVRMFDSRDLMDRYSSIVLENNAKVTGYLQTSLIEKYSDEIGNMAQIIPLEFGVHSHTHERSTKHFAEEVENSLNAYRDYLEVEPLGYRAPNGLIDRDGICTLMEYQFKYDASIFPSIRLDEYGYSNLHLPNQPFRFVHNGNEIIELPVTCLPTIRLVMSMSYIKLLGLDAYRTLMRLFPLPDVVIFDSHPYDYYVNRIAGNIHGWKRYAHLRNADQAFELFQSVISILRDQGYEFWYMSELYEHVKRGLFNLTNISVEKLN